MMSVNRDCVMCHTPIENCMGFVKASDFMEMIDGRPSAHLLRSHERARTVRALRGPVDVVWRYFTEYALGSQSHWSGTVK